MSTQPQMDTFRQNGYGGSGIHVTPQTIVSRAPRTGEVLGQVNVTTPLHIHQAMADARLGQTAWDQLGVERRLLFVKAFRDYLYTHRELIVETLAAEQGKARQDAAIEHLATIEQVDYYVRHGARILATQPAAERMLPHRKLWVARRPYGVALVISPWNYPLYLSVGPIISALTAGNSVIYKPSEYAAQVGEIIAAGLMEAGLPAEVFHILHGYGDVGAALIDARPDTIFFTGSVPTGRKIGQVAAEKLIPVTLELGGNDAAIVLADADLKRAAAGVAWAAMFNAGQTCGSVERVLVDRRIADQFVAELHKVITQNLLDRAGQPTSMLANVTTPGQMAIIESQVQAALAQGARAVTGGHKLDSPGQYYAPTILTDVTPDMQICQEETFGPVLTVLPFDTLEEAIALNNGTDFGLIASIWTRNEARARALAKRLQVGNVGINAHLELAGLSGVPWGGIKASGYGRSHGPEGLLEMTYSQTVMADKLPFFYEPFWYPYSRFKRGFFRRLNHLAYGPTLWKKLRALL